METNNINEYVPFSPVHPFEILEEELSARGITKKDFALQIGMKPSNLSRMLSNKGELSSEMALKLEIALGIPYLEWMRLQEAYIKDKMRTERRNGSPVFLPTPGTVACYASN